MVIYVTLLLFSNKLFKIENFVLQHQARTLCAKFSSKSHIMVSGDNKNVITLWRLDKEFPITVKHNLSLP